MTAPPSGLLELAVGVAQTAGRLLTGYAGELAAGGDLAIGSKTTATDAVSKADRAAERLIADRLRRARPDDGLLAEEEQADRAGTSGLRWVVDPLDGTVNFLYGLSGWAVSIACEDADGPLVGVIHHPAAGETFTAVRGRGAYLGARRLEVTEVAALGMALVATGFAYDPAVRADQARDWAGLLPEVRDLRRAGSAALDLAWVAAGRMDAYLEFGLQPWDWSAGRLVVTEAGGMVTEVARALGGERRVGLVAGGRTAHAGLVRWLDDHPRPRERAATPR